MKPKKQSQKKGKVVDLRHEDKKNTIDESKDLTEFDELPKIDVNDPNSFFDEPPAEPGSGKSIRVKVTRAEEKEAKKKSHLKEQEASVDSEDDMDDDMDMDDDRGDDEKIKTGLSKKEKMEISALVVMLLIGIGVAVYFYFTSLSIGGTAAPIASDETKKEEVTVPEQKLVAGLADGIMQSENTAQAVPYEVMIENLSTIRPQTGLSKASVVFEALAEGGITRFLAIFQGKTLDQIGPVRSARNYYLDWAEEFHGLYIHAGGSPTALSAIKNYDFTDINALTSDGKYFWRDKQDRAPHNLYTKTDLLNVARRDKGVGSVAKFDSWKFKDDTGSWIGKMKSDTVATADSVKSDELFRQATEIGLDFSTSGYAVKWSYDQAKNEYKRFNGGQSHTDRATGQQLTAKNVAVAKVKAKPLDEKRLVLDTALGGTALLFHDGIVEEGTWKKPVRGERMRFYNKDGAEIVFTRGATWVEVIPPDKKITY